MRENYAQFQSALAMLDRMYEDLELDVAYRETERAQTYSFHNRSDALIELFEELTQAGTSTSLWGIRCLSVQCSLLYGPRYRRRAGLQG